MAISKTTLLAWILLLVLQPQWSLAFEGYLCGDVTPNVTTVSTSIIGKCEMLTEEPDAEEVHI